ncbi:AAA family ATPase [Streptomyces achromogenes]|uniref:AAA family ATPase n=1 Tax=Streptomyces achromogenes TaxID=67255 RepID=UPI0036FBE783
MSHMEQPHSTDRPATVAELVQTRLADAPLPEPVKVLLKEALGDGTTQETPSVSRIYLESVAVTRFRGIGPRAWLKLSPRPGVNLVVGRNGSGKSSIAEAIETAFTGTNPRWEGRNAVRGGNWRNLHDSEGRPEIEVKLAIGGDGGRSTLTRTWQNDDFAVSQAELKRPGHGRTPLDDLSWKQALTDYRPFLSYVDLDRMISGKPSEMYDAIATILGLEQLSDAYLSLGREAKVLSDAEKAVEDALPGLKEALYQLEDDDRAVQALLAVDTAGAPDFEALDSLVTGLPAESDEGLIAGLRAAAAVQGPDTAQVGAAVDRLRTALAKVEDLRGTGADDALRRADLLERALAHHDRHPDTGSCPVCGTGEVLDAAWAADAIAQIAALREEAAVARTAREALRSAVLAVQDLVHTPSRIPEPLRDPWKAWTACRTIGDPAELAQCAAQAATVLADACDAVRARALKELEKRDERWRALVVRLADWAEKARGVQANQQRRRDLTKAQNWIRTLAGELREQRMEDFADQSQRVWERLRQESNVDLKAVTLKGSERATVRKLVMDVSIDGKNAPALSVMSQGEQQALALSLFLPRATTADSPFGFVVIDDPVQSMDPAKVNGLAQVLHELGQHRQVIVFTHDTRLQRAFSSQELPVTVFEVERGEASRVRVRPVTDPVRQALDDARALAGTPDLPAAARTHVLPSLCRIALENAFLEAAWIRHHRGGGQGELLQAIVTDADRFAKLAALALFGDVARAADVYPKLRAMHGRHATDLVRQCQNGAHPAGAQITDPHRFVDEITSIAEKVRKPEEAV